MHLWVVLCHLIQMYFLRRFRLLLLIGVRWFTLFMQFEWNGFWGDCSCTFFQGNSPERSVGIFLQLAYLFEKICLILLSYLMAAFDVSFYVIFWWKRSFSLPEFVAEVQEMIRPTLTAYFKVSASSGISSLLLWLDLQSCGCLNYFVWTVRRWETETALLFWIDRKVPSRKKGLCHCGHLFW